MTPTPAQADFASGDGEPMHVLDGILCVRLVHKLNEPAILPGRDFDIMNGPERIEERPQRVFRDEWR